MPRVSHASSVESLISSHSIVLVLHAISDKSFEPVVSTNKNNATYAQLILREVPEQFETLPISLIFDWHESGILLITSSKQHCVSGCITQVCEWTKFFLFNETIFINKVQSKGRPISRLSDPRFWPWPCTRPRSIRGSASR